MFGWFAIRVMRNRGNVLCLLDFGWVALLYDYLTCNCECLCVSAGTEPCGCRTWVELAFGGAVGTSCDPRTAPPMHGAARRDMHDNQITSIASGAFTGLTSVAQVCVRRWRAAAGACGCADARSSQARHCALLRCTHGILPSYLRQHALPRHIMRAPRIHYGAAIVGNFLFFLDFLMGGYYLIKYYLLLGCVCVCAGTERGVGATLGSIPSLGTALWAVRSAACPCRRRSQVPVQQPDRVDCEWRLHWSDFAHHHVRADCGGE